MTELFLEVVSLSVSASWLILAVIFLRVVLRRAPKSMYMVLWGMVAFRLLCPFSLQSEFSLIPEAVGSGSAVEAWAVEQEILFQKPMEEPAIPQVTRPEQEASVDPGNAENMTAGDAAAEQSAPTSNDTAKIPLVSIFAVIWLSGAVILVLYAVASHLHLYHRVQTAIPLRDNIYQIEFAYSSFAMGLIRPKIYIPVHVPEREMDYVIAHEQVHIARGDHWWKPFGFCLLAIHWFNPFVWVAYFLFCRDIELACDEKVIRNMGTEQRADYAQTLLKSTIRKRMILVYPVAFGALGVKERVKRILRYRKASRGMVFLNAVAIAVSAVCFLTVKPVQAESSEILPGETGPAVTRPYNDQDTSVTDGGMTSFVYLEDVAYSYDDIGGYLTYEGGEMAYTFRTWMTGDVAREGIGLIVYLNGQIQPYRVEGSDIYEVIHTFYPRGEANTEGMMRFTIYFTPVTGAQGDCLEMQIAMLQDPDYSVLDDGMDTIYKLSNVMSCVGAYRVKYNASPAYQEPVAQQDRVISVSTQVVETTSQNVADWSDIDWDTQVTHFLGVNSKPGAKVCKSIQYGCPANEPLDITLEIWGKPGIQYAVYIYVDGQPVCLSENGNLIVETRKGYKNVINVSLDVTDTDGETIIWAHMVPLNTMSMDNIGPWAAMQTSKTYFIFTGTEEEVNALTGNILS